MPTVEQSTKLKCPMGVSAKRGKRRKRWERKAKAATGDGAQLLSGDSEGHWVRRCSQLGEGGGGWGGGHERGQEWIQVLIRKTGRESGGVRLLVLRVSHLLEGVADLADGAL